MTDLNIHEREYWLSSELVNKYHCFDKPLSEKLTAIFNGTIAELGYKVAILKNKYVEHIGYGQHIKQI